MEAIEYVRSVLYCWHCDRYINNNYCNLSCCQT